MKFKPLYDRVVVRRLEAESTTKSGIIIPDNATDKPTQGEIVAVGQGALSPTGEPIPLTVSVGDRILFGQYAGTEVKLDGESLLVMKESDIFAIIENENLQEKAA